MKEGKPFRVILIVLFIVFISLYVSQATGYYDYQQYQKTEITAEKMKQFEKDVKDGKNIDLEDYLEDKTHNYNSKLSTAGLNVSNSIKNFAQKGIGGAFNFLARLLENN